MAISSTKCGAAQLSFDAHFTFSHAEGDEAGLVRGASRSLSSAFSVALQKGGFSMQLKQPTYFEQGDLHLSVPTRREAGGGVIFEARDFGLRAAQRPLEVQMQYGTGQSRFGMKLEKQSGEDAQLKASFLHKF